MSHVSGCRCHDCCKSRQAATEAGCAIAFWAMILFIPLFLLFVVWGGAQGEALLQREKTIKESRQLEMSRQPNGATSNR